MTGQASGQRKPSQRNTPIGYGIRATQAITAEYSYRVRDFSHNYREYSDLNDYLCGRKQEQKNGQKLLLRQKKGRGI